MPSSSEENQERVLRRDEVVVIRIDVTKVEVYLKQLIVSIRILITVALVLCLGTIFIWNFFAPTSEDVSDLVIVMLLNMLPSCAHHYRIGGERVKVLEEVPVIFLGGLSKGVNEKN